jgi:hypothetical protein
MNYGCFYYCAELADYRELSDEVYRARDSGQTDNQIRPWLLEKLKALAALHRTSQLS